ncbi:MAG: tRNA-dihydrouridine synthase family protein [Bacteroidales bacterium]|nr:tRNA-dihydrouridine synthase family protein [Candidatus Colimorpha onthohippi]
MPLILAPMQGLTERLFRHTFHQCFNGAFDYAISPFLSLTHGNLNDAWDKIDDVLPAHNTDSIPVVPQILGKETDEFVALANRLYDIGYHEVNWNIGCPMRRVAGKHRGSGILPYPNEVQAVLDGIIPKIKPALSIKMRLGYYDDAEISKIIPILNQYPIANITIHPRTGKQQYGGSVNLDRLAEILPDIKHPVIYNGDIRTVDQYHAVLHRFPQIAGVMIGRGALYNPTLPSQIKSKTYHDNASSLFIDQLIANIMNLPIPDQGKIRKIKEYWCLLWQSTKATEAQSKIVLRSATLDEVTTAIKKITTFAAN